jgi:hypothetical protein
VLRTTLFYFNYFFFIKIKDFSHTQYLFPHSPAQDEQNNKKQLIFISLFIHKNPLFTIFHLVLQKQNRVLQYSSLSTILVDPHTGIQKIKTTIKSNMYLYIFKRITCCSTPGNLYCLRFLTVDFHLRASEYRNLYVKRLRSRVHSIKKKLKILPERDYWY